MIEMVVIPLDAFVDRVGRGAGTGTRRLCWVNVVNVLVVLFNVLLFLFRVAVVELNLFILGSLFLWLWLWLLLLLLGMRM